MFANLTSERLYCRSAISLILKKQNKDRQLIWWAGTLTISMIFFQLGSKMEPAIVTQLKHERQYKTKQGMYATSVLFAVCKWVKHVLWGCWIMQQQNQIWPNKKGGSQGIEWEIMWGRDYQIFPKQDKSVQLPPNVKQIKWWLTFARYILTSAL